MNDVICFFLFVLLACFFVASGVFLVINGHPWFALLVFVLTACIRLSRKDEP